MHQSWFIVSRYFSHREREKTTNSYNVKIVKLNKYSAKELKIKLISVLNTTEKGSSESDTLDLDYDVDDTKEMPIIIKDIMHFITTKVPKFHYQLEDHHPTFILD